MGQSETDIYFYKEYIDCRVVKRYVVFNKIQLINNTGFDKKLYVNPLIMYSE